MTPSVNINLPDLLDGFFDLYIKVCSKLDERVEVRFLALKDKSALGLLQHPLNLELLEVDLGRRPVDDLLITIITRKSQRGQHQPKSHINLLLFRYLFH